MATVCGSLCHPSQGIVYGDSACLLKSWIGLAIWEQSELRVVGPVMQAADKIRILTVLSERWWGNNAFEFLLSTAPNSVRVPQRVRGEAQNCYKPWCRRYYDSRIVRTAFSFPSTRQLNGHLQSVPSTSCEQTDYGPFIINSTNKTNCAVDQVLSCRPVTAEGRVLLPQLFYQCSIWFNWLIHSFIHHWGYTIVATDRVVK